MRQFSVYGYTLATDHPLVSFLDASDREPDVVFTCQPGVPVHDEPGSLVYASVLPGAGDEGLFSLFRMSDGFRLHYSGTADFLIRGDRIDCHLHDPDYTYWVEIALLGPVLSFWLELHGSIALHASAVVQSVGAIGFIASSKSGKTSLASSFVKEGAGLLTDDILPLYLSQGGDVMARPGYPQMRMWADQAQVFAGDPSRFPLVHPDFDKRRIPAATLGHFHGTPARLSALFLPERSPACDAKGVTLTRVQTQEALVTLLQNSFAAAVLERMPEMQVQRLRTLAGILQRIPVFRLDYPEGYERLPGVREQIISFLERLVDSG
jgi:hypothetical protein